MMPGVKITLHSHHIQTKKSQQLISNRQTIRVHYLILVSKQNQQAMDQEQKFEGIFNNKINKKNISIVKKFFGADPVNTKLEKSLSPQNSKSKHYLKIPSLNQAHKIRKKQFTAGFQNPASSNYKIDGLYEAQSLQSMIISSKKAPTAEYHSFLLGVTEKVNRKASKQEQPRKKQKSYERFLLSRNISDTANSNIDEVLSTIERIKLQNKKRGETAFSAFKKIKNSCYSPDITDEYQHSTIESPSKIQDFQSQKGKIQSSKIFPHDLNLQSSTKLPVLEQKKSSQGIFVQEDEEQYQKQLNTPTNISSYSTKTNQNSENLQKSIQTYRQTSQKQRVEQSGISLQKKVSYQFFKQPEDHKIILKKGYLSYDENVLQILEKHKQKIYKFKELQRLNESDRKAYLSYRAASKENHRYIKNISASNYLVVNVQSLDIVVEKKAEEFIQIASLTKIMTCYLCLLICKKYNVNPKLYMIRVSDRAGVMPGTTAELQAGDIISLYDLMYGLMLPSGNDASVAIAESAGKIIQRFRKKPSKKCYHDTFIAHMNMLAKQLQIQQSFQNPSGLSMNPNFSSPRALTLLTVLALQNSQFCKIINCKEHQLEIRNERFGLIRKVVWTNTNKLLWKGWNGVKTGTTQSAGHCLMAYRNNYLISVFNCDTLGKRFSECAHLYKTLGLEQANNRQQH